jgi:hypothetical protein
MFEFVFRKKASIIILCTIIGLSLIFSLLFNIQLHEGMQGQREGAKLRKNNENPEVDTTDDNYIETKPPPPMNNPPPPMKQKIIELLSNDNLTIMEKMKKLQSIVKKYVVLNDIFKQNKYAYYNEFSDAISEPPKMDSNGTTNDPNAITAANREKAKQVLSNNNLSMIDKIIKLKELAGEDKKLTAIQTNYENAWKDMIMKNVSPKNT